MYYYKISDYPDSFLNNCPIIIKMSAILLIGDHRISITMTLTQRCLNVVQLFATQAQH